MNAPASIKPRGPRFHEDLIQGSEERYARLILLKRDAGRSGDGRVLSLWLCDCGAETTVAYGRVKAGTTMSCGCLGREVSSQKATTHGGRNTPEYSSWMAMRRRCQDERDKDYHRYGAVGIRVCPLWAQSFAAFLAHVGPRPAGTTIDRIDGRRGYEPGNVRWATPQVQGRNRRGTFIWHIRGQIFQSISEAAAAFSVSEQSVSRWVNGSFDKRRGTFTKPRSDCRVVERCPR